ncbi:FitA-like ribbon-helix-helix domain-containing protein [Brevundimonas sp. TSRC1-1]|uniref:FitA-like ribbon-helix-helix domain-containing protein n=1 Tax=Brevundimonas sp. TSRC1-1 TaxID=2804562 RepID=UPI003CEB9299
MIAVAMNIHVRNLDEETVRALEQRAARNGRSAEAEVRAILTAAAAVETPDRSDWIQTSDELRARSAGLSHTPSEILVRESRDER